MQVCFNYTHTLALLPVSIGEDEVKVEKLNANLWTCGP